MRLYHATTEQAAKKILTSGFDLSAPRTRDPGDFGWGIYFTPSLSRAKAMGKVILVADIDTKYFYTTHDAYCLSEKRDAFWCRTVLNKDGEMGTIHGDWDGTNLDRGEFSQMVREEMLNRGYNGLIWEQKGKVREVVVYEPLAIRKVSLRKKK
jgi:hypothetical protein